MSRPRRSPALLVLLAAVLLPGPVPARAGAQTLPEDLLESFSYRSIGPTRQSGRFVDFAVPRQQPYTFYAATASGGLWKTTNNGVSFEPIFDDQSVISIGAVEVAPSDPDIVLVGTGEANNSRSSYWGDGGYKSTDGGKTWTNMGLRESHHIGRIVVHPTNPDIVYVAALGHLYSENPERGLYRTTDGGETWEKVLGPVVRGKHIGVVDVVMDPTDPQVLYAATYDKVRLPFTFDLGGPGSRIYKTTDGGDTWTQLGGGLPGGMLGRIGIDVFERDPSILYATIENANKPGMSDEERYQELLEHRSSKGMIGGEVYRSDDAGLTWRKVSPDTLSVGGAPGYYYGQIIIDPNDPDVVYVLSAASWGTRDGGKTWQRRPLRFGGDDHALWIDPENSNHMLLGYDHGMGITYDGGRTWYHPDNLPLAQFYAVGYDMSRPYRVAGGTQDNGSHMGPSTKPGGAPIRLEDWERVGGGDGMYNVFETCENRYLYNESQFGPLQRVDLLTGETRRIRYEDEDLRWNWNAPILVSPHDCNVIYHAANKLLRSPYRGESWEVISPDLTKADPRTLTTGKGGDGNIQYATITTIAESPLEKGVIWVGTDDGNVQLTRDGGETWTLLNDRIPDNPEYWVSRVEASHHDAGTAYVSYTGYRRDDFRPFLYRTTDYGETWTSIAGNLPDEPINVIREDPRNPDLLFVGTEMAVYVSIDGGRSWARMKNNMPTQPVHDLQVHPRDRDLIVATHGRGIFIADVSALEQLTPDVLRADVHFFQPEDRIRWVGADRRHSSSSNYPGASEPEGVALYYYLRKDLDDDVTFTVYRGSEVVNEVEGPGDAGLHRVLWDMTWRRERSEEEVEEMRERARRFGGRFPGGEEALRYAREPAPPGEYRIVLDAGGRRITRTVSILTDEWYEERR